MIFSIQFILFYFVQSSFYQAKNIKIYYGPLNFAIFYPRFPKYFNFFTLLNLSFVKLNYSWNLAFNNLFYCDFILSWGIYSKIFNIADTNSSLFFKYLARVSFLFVLKHVLLCLNLNFLDNRWLLLSNDYYKIDSFSISMSCGTILHQDRVIIF